MTKEHDDVATNVELAANTLLERDLDGQHVQQPIPQEARLAPETSSKPARWRRLLTRMVIAGLLLVLVSAFLIRNHIRTLASLRRVPGTNAYVMDYYVDYHLDEIESGGMDVENIEDSFIKTFFPDVIVPIAHRVKRSFVPQKIETTENDGEHHCSTLFLKSSDGTCYFARNQDYSNDAFLILRVHDQQGLASIALVDLAYFNLDRGDLDSTNLIQRIPLLFAPYSAFDGINRHGVAVGIMSVEDKPVVPARDPNHPNVINTALMRIILDNARSTQEAIEIAKRYNVHFVAAPQHVLIGDAEGAAGVLEHIDGRVEFVESEAAWQVCTNYQMYASSEEESDQRCDRYCTGSAVAERLGTTFKPEDVQDAIRTMSVDGWTMWTTVYNLTDGDVSVIYKGNLEDPFFDHIKQIRD